MKADLRMSGTPHILSKLKTAQDLSGAPGLVKRTPFRFHPLQTCSASVIIQVNSPGTGSHLLIRAVYNLWRREHPGLDLRHVGLNFDAPSLQLWEISVVELLTPLRNYWIKTCQAICFNV